MELCSHILEVARFTIETTNSLNTDSFIQVLCIFITRSGSVHRIYSNNGTNFVGTVNEL